METVNEQTLSNWTKPAFVNEDEKRDKTEKAIKHAIAQHPILADLPVSVYPKGSYKNNTNVRRDSDVDVAVELTSVYKAEFEEGVSKESVGFEPYSEPYDTDDFKDHVGEALDREFGAACSRGNKVFRIRGSATTLDADVVPCYTHRWFTQPAPSSYVDGILLIPDKPSRYPLVNYPAQHYKNGCDKNLAARKRFKSVVRVLKNLENHMCAEGHPDVASYLIESLVYNAPDPAFNNAATWAEAARNVLVHIWHDTEDAGCEKRWFEVNGIMYLFHDSTQRWTREEARDFTYAAWQYLEKS